MAKTDFQTIDEYIASFPEDDQKALTKIRETVRAAVPEAEEVISYQIPAFKHHGFVIYFSAYKRHYSLSFPPPWTVFEAFREPLSKYVLSKSSVQLPKDDVPYELIGELARFRADENLAATKDKKK